MTGLVFRLAAYVIAGAALVYAVVGLTTSTTWYDAPFMRGMGPHQKLDRAVGTLANAADHAGVVNADGLRAEAKAIERELRDTYLRQAAVAGAVFVLVVVAPVEVLLEARRAWRRARARGWRDGEALASAETQ